MNWIPCKDDKPEVKARPILFSGEMVKAILEGRKTQTRRIGKCQMDLATELGVNYIGHQTKGRVAVATYRAFPKGGPARHGLCECPYGIPGDRLWVRETFSAHGAFGTEGRITYRADCGDGKEPHGLHWKPAIFMPLKLSRITLEIVALRAERLQDISEKDALAEGISWPDVDGKPYRPPIDTTGMSSLRLAANRYKELWESINGKGSWALNPWCWCIEFKRL